MLELLFIVEETSEQVVGRFIEAGNPFKVPGGYEEPWTIFNK